MLRTILLCMLLMTVSTTYGGDLDLKWIYENNQYWMVITSPTDNTEDIIKFDTSMMESSWRNDPRGRKIRQDNDVIIKQHKHIKLESYEAYHHKELIQNAIDDWDGGKFRVTTPTIPEFHGKYPEEPLAIRITRAQKYTTETKDKTVKQEARERAKAVSKIKYLFDERILAQARLGFKEITITLTKDQTAYEEDLLASYIKEDVKAKVSTTNDITTLTIEWK